MREISSKHTYEWNVNNTKTSMIFLAFLFFTLGHPTYHKYRHCAVKHGYERIMYSCELLKRERIQRKICASSTWPNAYMYRILSKCHDGFFEKNHQTYLFFVCLSVSILQEMETAKTKLRSCKNKALTAIRSLCLWPIWSLTISYLFEVFSFIAKQNTLPFIQFSREFPRFLLIIILFTNTFVDFDCIRFFRHKIRINQSINKEMLS